jgi:hypothetical protein
MEKNFFLRAWWVILLAAAFLLIYPALHERIPLLRDNLRAYNFYESLRSTRPKEKPRPKVKISPKPVPEVVNPSAEVQISAYDPNTNQYHGLTFLSAFFEKLRQRKSQIRVAYFGDSSIEGDLICQTFRDSLQKRFGGQGVGFVGIENPIPGFRQSVRLSFSPTWQRKTIVDKDPGRFPFGISGENFRAWFPRPAPVDSTLAPGLDTLAPPKPVRHWAEWGGSKSFYGTQAFSLVRLFYGQAQRDTLRQTKNKVTSTFNGRKRELLLDGAENVNSVILADTLTSRVRADFKISGALPLYGVSLETPKGIIVDNFSMRGNSGRSLMRIQGTDLQRFQELLDYDLIIFQYGLNVLNAKLKNYDWYTREMNQVIQHFQEAMPGVPILLVGPSDKSIKVGTVMHSDPSVYLITEAQRQSALDKSCAFFSLYEAMGGEDSMVEWVERRRPKLANLDYTHFNSNGAKVAGNFLLAFVLGGYQEYEHGFQPPH